VQLSSETSIALNALVLSEQIRFKQTPETVSYVWQRYYSPHGV